MASLAITGAKTCWQDFISEHGSTSIGDDLDGIFDSSRRTSSRVTSENVDSFGPACRRTSKCRTVIDWSADAMLAWIWLTDYLFDEVLAERRHQSRTVSVIVKSLAVSVQQTLCHAPGGLHVAGRCVKLLP